MEFKPPNNFSFSTAAEWPNWKQKFDIFLLASEKYKSEEKVKIATFLACIGDDGINLYNTIIKDKKDTLEKLIQEFDLHLLPKKVVTIETFTFNQMKQEETMSIEEYLTELKKQAMHCDFLCVCNKSYEDRMIRDRLILGMKDKECQMRLLREKDLTVDKIIEYCKTVEISKQHVQVLNPDHNLHAVKRQVQKIHCKFCLYEHERGKCPAYNKTCAQCQRKGHFARACKNENQNSAHQKNEDDRSSSLRRTYQDKSRTENRRQQGQGNNNRNILTLKQGWIGNVAEEEQEEQNTEGLIFVSECNTNNRSSWYKNLEVANKIIKFKLDTGADVSILPKNVYDTLLIDSKLNFCNTTLITYGNFKVKPLGEVILKCSCNNILLNVKFIVVDFHAEPLLSLNDCVKFNLIQRIDNILTTPRTKDELYMQFKDVFEGLGKITGECTIKLSENAKPVVQLQRKVPLSLHEPLRETLNTLVNSNIIEKVDYPTKWVNSLMIVEKPDKSLRLCIDPKPLNKYICREHFSIPTSSDIIGKLTGNKIFTVIDMKHGFWHLSLDKDSSDLCTFNTPFGRYKFKRLPFGISSAPEIFQRKCFEIFGDIKGLSIYFDDLILASKNENEHDKSLLEIFKRAREHNIKFNFKKLQYKCTNVKFMGLTISSEGVYPCKDNIEAIRAIETPKNKTEVLRILGLVKFFSKFVPNLTKSTKSLRDLTRKDVHFHWTDIHTNELNKLKDLISHSPILKIFDPNIEITIQCDASSEGLGCVLLQNGYPVSYASRTLSKTEKRYAQIEKELLAICFAFEKFHYLVYGHQVTVQSDHKPLGPIFSKDLDKISNRLQRMRLRLLKYDIKIVYLPGKDMLIADLLSRSYIKNPVEDDPEMQYVIHMLYQNVNMSVEKKELFKTSIDKDPILSQVKLYANTEWPDKCKNLSLDLKHYIALKDKIFLSNDLLFLENKIIVPNNLRQDMLFLVHKPHFGIEKTKLRARQIFYWPSLNKDIENFIAKCEPCQLNQRMNQKESLVCHDLPERPWQYIFADFFEHNSKNYLLLIDSYSNWIEVTETKTKSAEDVVKFCKQVFSRLGIPDTFYSDNVPFNSKIFKQFSQEWHFKVVYSSPHHHQSNGLAERAVGIVKNMLIKSGNKIDLYELILEYNNTPLPFMSYSPAELIMSRTLRTKIPVSDKCLKPKVINRKEIQNKLQQKQINEKKFYDKSSKDLKPIQINEPVLFQNNNSWVKGKIKDKCNDRSYIVTNEYGKDFRRNRIFLKPTKLDFNMLPNTVQSIYDFDFHSLFDDTPPPDSSLDREDNVCNDSNGQNLNLSDSSNDNSENIVLDQSHNNSENDLSEILKLFENSNNIEILMDNCDSSDQPETTIKNSNVSDGVDLCVSKDQDGVILKLQEDGKRNRKCPNYLNDYVTNFSSDSD